MSHMSFFNSPFLLGFEDMERTLTRLSKTSHDNYPPYNIECVPQAHEGHDIIRITLAVAGFTKGDLDVRVEERQLYIVGQQADKDKDYLHRGIAARDFQRVFVLADGIDVQGADLANGLLCIDLVRPEAKNLIQKVDIKQHD